MVVANDLTPDEVRLYAAQNSAHDFAKKCRSVEEHTPAQAETELGGLVEYLITELWDNGFSVAEVSAAFEAAAKNVRRYAGPDERNGTGIRGTAIR